MLHNLEHRLSSIRAARKGSFRIYSKRKFLSLRYSSARIRFGMVAREIFAKEFDGSRMFMIVFRVEAWILRHEICQIFFFFSPRDLLFSTRLRVFDSRAHDIAFRSNGK